jgi:hypothetical protein
MYLNLIKLLVVVVLFFSCAPTSGDEKLMTENILTEEKLVDILTCAYLSEGASGINIKNVPGEKFDSTYLFNPLKENNVDKEKFDSTMAYYTSRPKKLKGIYDKVLAKLSEAQAKGTIE